MSKDGEVLVRRPAHELAGELTLGPEDRLMVTKLTFQVGSQVDIHDGEKRLLAYALTLPGAWLFCGPDNGTVKAMQILLRLDRMVSFEALANAAGHRLKNLPYHFSERWLSNHRTQSLLHTAALLE